MNLKALTKTARRTLSRNSSKILLGFGHDLIEDQKSEDELHDMVQEEVRRQLAEKNSTS